MNSKLIVTGLSFALLISSAGFAMEVTNPNEDNEELAGLIGTLTPLVEQHFKNKRNAAEKFAIDASASIDQNQELHDREKNIASQNIAFIVNRNKAKWRDNWVIKYIKEQKEKAENLYMARNQIYTHEKESLNRGAWFGCIFACALGGFAWYTYLKDYPRMFTITPAALGVLSGAFSWSEHAKYKALKVPEPTNLKKKIEDRLEKPYEIKIDVTKDLIKELKALQENNDFLRYKLKM